MSPSVESVDVDRGSPARSIHPWWAQRWSSDAHAAVQLVASEIHDLDRGEASDDLPILDLSSGTGAIAGAAANLGFPTTAIDNSPVATLIARCRLDYGRDPALIEQGQGWLGLEAELGLAVDHILEQVREGMGEAWMTGTGGRLVARATTCPSCGAIAPRRLVLRLDRRYTASWSRNTGTFAITKNTEEAERTRHQHSVSCPSCNEEIQIAADPFDSFLSVAAVTGTGQQISWSEPSDVYRTITADSPFLFPLDETFTTSRGRNLSWRLMTSGRQRSLLTQFVESTRREVETPSDRWVGRRRTEALSAFLGLFVSSLLPYLTVGTRFGPHGKIMPSTSRHIWQPSPSHAEISGDGIGDRTQQWLRSVHAVLKTNGSRVSVLRGDMRHLPFDDDTFAAVIWDPPYYDNIDYDSLTQPFEQVLRATIPDHPDIVLGGTGDSEDDSQKFNLDEYENSIRMGAREAKRVARDHGRVAIWWRAKHDLGDDNKPSELEDEEALDDLSGLVDMLQHEGLMLTRAIWLRPDRPMQAAASRHRQYLLVFEPSSGSPSPNVDTDTVMKLADEGEPTLYEGLTGLLLEELTTDEIKSIIPADYVGSLEQRLMEHIAGVADPMALLEYLERRSLADRAMSIDPVAAADPLDRAAHARVVLRHLGWSIPQPAGISIEDDLSEIDRLVAKSTLDRSDSERKATAMAAAGRVQSILTLSVRSWSRFAIDQGSETSISPLPEIRHFGHWQDAFVKGPKELSAIPGRPEEIFSRIVHEQKKARTTQVLDAMTRLRSKAAHPEDHPAPTSDELTTILTDTHALLRRLSDGRYLPIVLEPVQERRERYGRLTLSAQDGRGRSVEIHLSEPVDLTRPLIWIPMATNPRNVDPPLLDASETLAQIPR